MSIKSSPIICDICGIEKQSVNHWWWVRLEGKAFKAGSLGKQKVPSPNDHHACGQAMRDVLSAFFDYWNAGRKCTRRPKLGGLNLALNLTQSSRQTD